jgi:hypothetical protein
MITHDAKEGSATLYRSGAVTAFEALMKDPGLMKKIRRPDLEAWQLFDDIVNHQDRHGKNWMANPARWHRQVWDQDGQQLHSADGEPYLRAVHENMRGGSLCWTELAS